MLENMEYYPDEEFCRIIFNPPQITYKRDDGSIASSVFKDEGGVSVDRVCGDSDEDVMFRFCNRLTPKDFFAFFFFRAKVCIDSNIVIIHKPLPKNGYHYELYNEYTDDKEYKSLTRGQSRALAKQARKVMNFLLDDLEW